MILIRAGRVLGPAEGLDIKADVVLDGDRIAGIFPADQGGAEGAPGFSTRERQYEQIIEAEGLAAAPGLVDVHVHFRDPGPTYKEDIHTGARAAAKGGFTTVVCMANTNPIVDNEETLRYGGKKDRHPCVKLRRCVKGICRQGADRHGGTSGSRGSRIYR